MAVANLALRFVVELLGVGFVGYWAFGLTDGSVLRFVAAGLAIAAFVAVWGLLLAPNANSGLSQPQKDLLGTVVLLVAAAALALAGHPAFAGGYAVIVIVNALLLVVFGEDARSLMNVGRNG
jgi:Protein of unknown function (DUF2568)